MLDWLNHRILRVKEQSSGGTSDAFAANRGVALKDRFECASGQVLVIFAVAMIAILGFAALSIDVGHYLAERRSVQNATDASAMAAGRLVLRNDTNNLQLQIESFVAANGFPDATVNYSWNPGDDEVNVSVTHDVDRFFLGAVYDGDWSVTTEATARTAPEDVPFALIALGEDPNCNDPTGVQLSGAAMDFSLIGGGIGSNSCIFANNPNIDGQVDGNIEAQGEISDYFNDWDVSGTITDGQGYIPDPYLNFAQNNDPMATADCANVDPEIVETGSGGNRTWTMEPGRYTSASDLSPGGNVRDVIMQPGVYCFEEELRLSSANTSLDASQGVLIYLASPNGNFSPGNSDYEITSLGEDWADIAIWSDNCNEALDMHGNGQMTVNGVIYAPCSFVELGGNTGQDVVNGQVVAHDVWIHGNVTFNIDAGLKYTASPLRVFLVQ